MSGWKGPMGAANVAERVGVDPPVSFAACWKWTDIVTKDCVGS